MHACMYVPRPLYFNIEDSIHMRLQIVKGSGFLSNSLLDDQTDTYSVNPREVHADRIDVPMLTLQKELHLIPK